MHVNRHTFDEVMVPCYAPQDMVLVNGKGSYLYDQSARCYIDFSAGIAVNCLGHNHKGVVDTINKQAHKLLHVSNIFANEESLKLASKLTKLTHFDKVFFTNSGAESNEAALKLARRYACDRYGESKYEIISFHNSFHGRTYFSVSVGGQKKYSQGFGPAIDGIVHLPFNDIEAFKAQISDKTCAVILEPIQGEGGIVPIKLDFLQQVKALCTQYNALLIFDEVQTGVGRTGAFYAYQDLNVIPHILTSAKGLGAGVPLGAMLCSNDIAQHFSLGVHGSTFGGNPLACAVGNYVVDKVSSPRFLAQVRAKGEIFKVKLKALNDKYHVFSEIRGQGLLIGAQMNEKYLNQANRLQQLCTKHQLLTLVASNNVLRLVPPLNISHQAINEGFKLLERALKDFIC